ncbi:MAG: replication-associated recombination protein A [Pseudomonadales bacterium]|nr:replication-associated recombination protein A [Pseudomonadales bacterium]
MTVDDLFAATSEPNAAFQPMAARMRAKTLADYVGQQHILGTGMALREAVEHGHLHSMILWGPPGVGKTTLAKIIAGDSDAQFIEISAVLAGVKDIRAAVEKAQLYRHQYNKATVLFVDEVHRFNKAQQDAFLPHIENGEILFIGATTENPSFELNSALLSRARVYVLKSLQEQDLQQLLQRVLEKDPVLADIDVRFDEKSRQQLIAAADGDARRVLNLLEIALDLVPTVDGQKNIGESVIKQVLAQSYRRFDKGGEQFYDQISAMHKSIRGSAPDAALYWLCRMLDGGCDALYLARRIVRTASEDIGNADPRALEIAMNAWQVQERLGSPEGELALAQAVIYLASAPKSNAVYTAFNACRQLVASTPTLDVPMHLRNAPTKLMKELDYGEGYRYAHDEPEAFAAGEGYLPVELADMQFYQPVNRGLEIKIAEKLSYFQQLNAASTNKRYGDD